MVSDIKVITLDVSEEKLEKPLQVKFFIPKGNAVQFNEKRGDYYLDDGELILTDYSGAISVPTNVAINIPNIYNRINIEGIIGSPAHITGKGSLYLIIKPESGLELLAHTTGLLIVDKKIYTNTDEDYNTSKDGCGKSFSDIKKQYLEEAVDDITIPSILDTNNRLIADFRNSKIHNLQDIDICMREKLVNITKLYGITNLFYKTDEYKKINIKNNKSNSVDDLKIDLENAIRDEKFEKAAKIRDDIRRRELMEYGNKNINNDTTYNK